MEGFFGREHTCAAIVEAGKLQRVFVGLGSAVDQEELLVGVAADLTQPLGELTL